MGLKIQIFGLLLLVCASCSDRKCFEKSPLVFTVATQYTDGYQRFERSASVYDIDVRVLGMGHDWKGGNMNNVGGGHKVNMLLNALQPYKDHTEQIVLFTDAYDVIFLSSLDVMIARFIKTEARVLFSAELYCWPDIALVDKYPAVKEKEKRFLNSGMYMGYVSDIHALLSRVPLADSDDDQLFFTEAYLDESLRQKHRIKLDHRSEIFQNLNGAITEVELGFMDDPSGHAFLTNMLYNTKPAVLHGNGPSKIALNSLANYLPNAWTNKECIICKEGVIKLPEDEEQLPIVSLSIFVEKPTPFLDDFFDNILALNYPKQRMHMYIHSGVADQAKTAWKFINENGLEYKSMKTVLHIDGVDETTARDLAIRKAMGKKSDYIFFIDSDVRLDNPETLRLLIAQNRTLLAPLVSRPGEAWSNFWGALSNQGFYARSQDYMDIIHGERKGIWNVPFVNSVFLASSSIFDKLSHFDGSLDPDMALCSHLRKHDIFMYVTNMEYFGHLVSTDNYNPKVVGADLYQLLQNKADWERKYIHPEFFDAIHPNYTAQEPCPDVYWFPIVTERFCKDLISVMENFGKWSDGRNSDERLDGGYEAVPTRDIHMNQVGLEPVWMNFLKNYVRPLQESVFTGYYHDPPKSLMNFVVRYRPDEQPSLRPHHDSSTYTINIALNRPGIDYEGGGCNFLRYKCSVTNTRVGWMLMHPGRLTHYHEGLRVTSGTRYIMISFIDP